MAIIAEAMRMQIDLRWSETANALIIVLIATTAFPFQAICRIRKSIYRLPVHVHPPIIIIVSLGAHECLISLEHVLAWDKLVNHSIMRSFLILGRISKPRPTLRKYTNAQSMWYRSIYEFNNLNLLKLCIPFVYTLSYHFQHYRTFNIYVLYKIYISFYFLNIYFIEIARANGLDDKNVFRELWEYNFCIHIAYSFLFHISEVSFVLPHEIFSTSFNLFMSFSCNQVIKCSWNFFELNDAEFTFGILIGSINSELYFSLLLKLSRISLLKFLVIFNNKFRKFCNQNLLMQKSDKRNKICNGEMCLI